MSLQSSPRHFLAINITFCLAVSPIRAHRPFSAIRFDSFYQPPFRPQRFYRRVVFTYTCGNIIVIGNDSDDNNNKVGEVMVRRWSGYYKKRILELLPVDGSRVRSKGIHAKAREMGMGPNTVQNYLNLLVEEGSVKLVAEKPKEVYYSRCERARIENLISEFMKEIDSTLSKLPVEMRDLEKQLIEGSRTKAEGRDAAKILRSEPVYLKSLIMTALLRKAFEMHKAMLHPQLRDKDFYLGYFDQSLHLAWRSEVEGKAGTQHSVKS